MRAPPTSPGYNPPLPMRTPTLPTSPSLDRAARDGLDALDAAGLLRRPRTVRSEQGPEVDIDGHRVVLLCSNDYLGLASDPELRAAATEAIARFGTGAAASRLISGTMTPHLDAERTLADLVGAPASLLFSTGYAANVGALQTLVGPDDLVLSDALNHASLIDGCRLSRATVRVYRHTDVEHLAELLAAHRGSHRRCLVVTDGLFSMDGDRAPLAALRRLCDAHDAWLMVDEAHALGVLGPRGSGACAEAGIQPDILVGTLGKALGGSGAFVASERSVVLLLANRARSFVFSTAPSPASAVVAQVAAHRAAGADDLRSRLRHNTQRLRTGLRELGYSVPEGDTPIVPVLLGDPQRTMQLSAHLFERGVFAHGIRPPTVPAGTCRLRCVPTAAHTDAHLDRVLEAFAAERERMLR